LPLNSGELMKLRLQPFAFASCAYPPIFLFLLFVAPAFCSLAAIAQTVDEVIAKNIQAHGGVDKLKSVQSLRTLAKYTQGPFRADYRQENKRADKVREEFIIQGLAQVQAYDGKTGWQISPFSGRKDPELLSQDDLKSLIVDSDIDGPLVDYKEKGHKAELVGHDSVEGTECYKIKLSMKNGDVRYYYLDADSYLELKTEVQTTIRGALQESELYYGDYEQVNGIYYPFSVEQAQKGSSTRSQISVEKIEQNIPLDDARFSMPASKPAAKAAAAAN
jgi:Outer membrane lipoprotein-sorting protein